MTTPISTDDGAIQSGTSAAKSQLDSANATASSRPPAAGVDPRLTAAVDDAGAQNRRSAERTGDGIDRTGRDSAGKTAIDNDGAGRINGTGGGNGGNGGNGGSGRALLGALGSALGGGGSPPAAAAAPPMASMPPMPQVPAATAGQSLPMSLSNPAVAQLISKLIAADGGPSAVGMGGLSTLGGHGGGSGLTGPLGAGGNRFEQKLLAHAQQVAAARLPYAWGGGTVNGPSQGTRDGGAADAAGDYRKRGFDCSSLARYLVYQASGVEIPRTSQAQYYAGVTVSAADARPGDLLFPSSAGVPPHHVTIYVGGGKCIEASQSGTIIGYSNAQSGTFKRFVAAG